MDFAPLAMLCVGYNALDMMVEAYLGAPDDNEEGEGDGDGGAPSAAWEDRYPDVPQLRAHGCMVHLVCYASGDLAGPPRHLREMSELPTVVDWEVYDAFCAPGSRVGPTVDITTDAGWVQLAGDDPDEVERDYARIVEWMPTMFDVVAGAKKEEEEGPPPPRR
jgi:hypothetical protein